MYVDCFIVIVFDFLYLYDMLCDVLSGFVWNDGLCCLIGEYDRMDVGDGGCLVLGDVEDRILCVIVLGDGVVV